MPTPSTRRHWLPNRSATNSRAAAADHALVGWLAMPLPSAVTDLLDNEWRKLLVRHSMDGDNAAWEAAMDTVSELVASVDIPSDVPSRKRLAARLPTLVRRICNGLRPPGDGR
ncbi:MAG: DUF1631 family protein [Candidatus Accumulibacter sp.]|uniref:DUF1631 family protein n=1 Tax=Accumulibacter sp. TaxID=2053492 RepID=UPI00258F7746|nr:DUF1631 family protein [Accumulibacter sp.]MBK8116389.1 DUF1631 family protein [Accumulibacter sp.]